MIHETLLFLWNIPENFFFINDKDEWLKMVELDNFIHPGDKNLLKRIMFIAIEHYEIQNFIGEVMEHNNKCNIQNEYQVFQTNYNNKNEDNIEFHLNGLYLKAFCHGLDDALQDYRNDIVNLEKEILTNSKFSLSYVLSHVEKYVTLFETLKSVINSIKREKIQGCLLIGKFHKYFDCGIKIIEDAMVKIIRSLNIVFYRQLSNWIVFGDLIDVYEEFFIYDAKCHDEEFLCSLSSDGEHDTESFNGHIKRHRFKHPAKVRKFYIKRDVLPINISIDLAQKILFMGRMVWIMRNDPLLINDACELKPKRDVWDGKEKFYFRNLQELEKYPFNIASFENAIEDCRVQLRKYLWKVFVEEGNLFDHLQLLRDYFLLGRGELFQHFLITVEQNQKKVLHDHLAVKLNTIFNVTAKKLYSDNDKTYQRFELVLSKDFKEISDSKVTKNQWLEIEMKFEIIWPLHIIFHPGAIALYNKLFSFLLRIKKAQIDIQRIWSKHMKANAKINSNALNLRNTLTFLINNLQYYLQVDVIETQYSILKKNVTNAKNIEDIICFHSEFLGNLMCNTFLMSPDDKVEDTETEDQLYKLPSLKHDSHDQVHNILIKFLQFCEIFSREAEFWGPEMTKVEMIQLGQLQSQCNKLIHHLLKSLKQISDCTSGSHLAQLLHQIDFNHWFTKNKSFS